MRKWVNDSSTLRPYWKDGLRFDSNDGAVKVMEFGAALDAFADLDVEQEDVEQNGVPAESKVLDDYSYASPEQAKDPNMADARSDLYSLGSTLYDCLAGHPPFNEKNLIRQVVCLLCDDPRPLSSLNQEIPAAFDDTMAGLLAKDPEDRFQKAKHVVFALDQYVPSENDPEQVNVVEVSSQYLEWVKSKQPITPQSLPPAAEGPSPELAGFLEWMADISMHKKKKSQQ